MTQVKNISRKIKEWAYWYVTPPQGIDWAMVTLVFSLVMFGLVMVYSSSYIFAQEKTGDGLTMIRKQIGFAILGFGALWATARINYRRWSNWAYPFFILALILLLGVLIPGIGTRVGGAQRWLRMGAFNFQPGELAKFALIFFVARQLDLKRTRLHQFTAGVLSQLLVPLPALVLLLAQPDFGTTCMIVGVIFALMFIAGVPARYLMAAAGLAFIAGLWLALGTTYRRDRLMTFIDPWRDPGGKGFQILQSFVGLHNGNILGVGLGNGKEKLFYLPEAHNDFIGSVIGEELGFLGVLGLVLAYVLILFRGIKISYGCFKNHQDLFGLLLGSGITLALALQGFVNLSVVFGLLPTKGLTLPFVSYGGSALLVDLFAMGVLLSIARGPEEGAQLPEGVT